MTASSHLGRITFFAVCLSLFNPLQAAMNNNVRVDQFEWTHAQTEHFDIYYDKRDERHLPQLAHYLEGAWKEVGEKFNFYVPERTPFFFFSNHNKFEQNNIVRVGEGTGGVTEAFKNRFLVFNDGSQTWLKHVIYHEFVHVVQFHVLFGGWWKSVRLLKSPFYALWTMEGMAEYGAGDIDESTGDMVIRDAVYTNTLIGLPELQGFNHVKPNQVTLGYKTGGAAIEYLADDYGPEKVSQLLVVMEGYFDISSALVHLLGTDLPRFDRRFREWLDEKYADIFARAKPPAYYGEKLTKSNAIPQFLECPVFSPDGKQVYYFGDSKGMTEIYVHDLERKTTRSLVSLKWGKFEHLHSQGRGLSLSRDGRWLAFAGEKKQRDFLFLYDLEEKKLTRVRTFLEQLRSPVFSPVDDTLVVVGMEDGYNDLYIINMEGEMIERLTNNPQDEMDPVFSPDGTRIVYSGEVMTADGLDPMGRDLYSVAIRDKLPQRLLALPGQLREPEFLPDGSLIFVRDQNDDNEMGYNLVRWDPRSGRREQVTDAVGGAFSPRYVSATNQLYYVGFFSGEKHIYDFSASTFTARFETVLATSSAIKENLLRLSSDKNGEGVLDEKSKAVTQALHSWSDGLVSPLLDGSIRPYRWRASTDLFLPFFFYSSLDGFVLANIWQASDYLGNHQVQQQMQMASGADYLDVFGAYTYSRYRPDFALMVRDQRYWRDVEQTERRRELNVVGLMSYPLDRVQAVTLGLGITDREDSYLGDLFPREVYDDRFFLASYQYDTITGRYLVPTRGRRFNIFYQQASEDLGGNQDYKSGGAQADQYVRLPREGAFATRLFYGRSTGRDPREFRMGGVDRIRALNRRSDANRKQNVVLSSAEIRYRLAYLNARTKWLYPDFFFKAAYLVLFDDIGYGWDSAAERDLFSLSEASNSTGVGIYWPTFILQSFQLNIGVQWSVLTNDGTQIWYITLGPSF